jgi:hypothetical protein
VTLKLVDYRLDYDYLREIMLKMGLTSSWVIYAMVYIETVDYSLLVNGAQVSHIVSGYGLCQGDPLLPYLFILSFEVLSSLICDVNQRNDIQGTIICTEAPSISHLLFADDSFIFFKLVKEMR